ncbi:type IV pilin protein [Thermodesulfobacteriota bacterium]
MKALFNRGRHPAECGSGGKRNPRGYTLMEILVCVVIIGILAVIAISSMPNFRKKSLSTEAKNTLGDIRSFQESYFFEYGRYAGDLTNLGFDNNAGQKYSYDIESASTFSCVLRAAGKVGTDVEDTIWKLEIVNRKPSIPTQG